MSKLTASGRRGLRRSAFALPAQRKYPVHDRAHAANAKARARQQLNKGNLSKGQYKQVVGRANSVLRRVK